MSPRIKKHLVLLSIILPVLAINVDNRVDAHEIINTGKWTFHQLNARIAQASKIKDTPERIDFISRQFLGVPYQEKTLVGDAQTPEVLTINLAGVDCFTLLDYVEAMRRSQSFDAFKENLIKIRYQSGIVDYQRRNHYFTDWVEFNADRIADVTKQIGADKAKTAIKILNGGTGNKKLLPGVPSRKRIINYIPAEALSKEITERLKTGDYVGIYTNHPDIDVSHVGIVIRNGKKLLFRHASSKAHHRKVVDEDFMEYMINRPGLVILQVRPIK